MPARPRPAPPPGSGPQRVFAAAQAWPLHDADATRQLEATALATAAPHALMARAGLATARLALAVAPHARRIGVLAGPGNNGGDAVVAALHLQRLGIAVQVLGLADRGRLPADAADAWARAEAQGLPMAGSLADLATADLLIDGLLGLGATRAPAGPLAAAIAAANAGASPILAIDLPSGLSADHGRVLGGQAIRARWTLSLLSLKPGLFTGAGRDHAGEVWYDDLGVAGGDAQAWLGDRAAAPPPGFGPRRHTQHKGSFGDLHVVGGAPGMTGAAVLAARAALTAGAGRVYLSLLDPAPIAPDRPELMRRPEVWRAGATLLQRATFVCGCGGGEAVRDALPPLLSDAGRLVLDADALNAIAGDAALQESLRRRASLALATILTPHPLEAARLLGITAADVQADRLAAATRLAATTQAVVVLKGSGSVVAVPGQPPWINASGHAALATPGSGDVLAGWIGGLWAQRDAGPEAAAWAARASVWLHGHAADRALALHPRHRVLPLRAGDLVDAMAAALD
jgi:ADP-dependent NAD(P)H-hydrate dehydratase / NAD(P)H-hydrate epimerase